MFTFEAEFRKEKLSVSKEMETTNFEGIFRAIAIPCLVLKPDGKEFVIVDANNDFLQTANLKLENLKGKFVREVFPKKIHLDICNAEVFYQSLYTATNELVIDRIDNLRHDLPLPDGSGSQEKYWTLVNIPVTEDSGQLKYILHTIQDVTSQVLLTKEQQRAKEELRTATIEKREVEAILEEREETLRKSNQKFTALVQEGSDVMAIIDTNGNYLFASDTSFTILGIPPEKFIGKNAFDLIHPDDRDSLMKQLAALETNKRAKAGPFRFKNGRGEWRWLETTATNLTQDPAIMGVVINSRDITTIVEQANEIEQILERYSLAATASQDLMYDWDLKTGDVVRFHLNLSDVFGHSLKEANNKNFWKSNIHPDERELVVRGQQEALKDKKRDFINTEYRFRRADGSYAYIIDRGFIIRDSQGNAIRLVGASSDISEMKAREEDLKIANQRFNLAMKATKEIIWDWDVIGGTVERSKILDSSLGYLDVGDPKQNEYWMAQIHKDDRDRVETSINGALADVHREEWIEEYRLQKLSGELVYVQDRGFIVRNEEGKPIRMVGSALNVTESRKAMEQINLQNKLLKEIAWEQSHLVRAPLTRLMALLELTDLEGFEGMTQKEIHTHLRNSAVEMDEILRRIVKKTQKIAGSDEEAWFNN